MVLQSSCQLGCSYSKAQMGLENPFQSSLMWLWQALGTCWFLAKGQSPPQVGLSIRLFTAWQLAFLRVRNAGEKRAYPRQKPLSFLYPTLRSGIQSLLPCAVGHIDQPKHRLSSRAYTNLWIPRDRDHLGPSGRLATTDTYGILHQEYLS